MAAPNTRADHSASLWLAYLENNFPDPGVANNPQGKAHSAGFRDDARALHRVAFPELYPTDPDPIPPGNALLELDVFVPSGQGPVRGGIPIHVGGLAANPARCVLGAIAGACSVEAAYPNGKPRWVRVVLPAAAPTGWGKLKLYAAGTPLAPITMIGMPQGGIRAHTFEESASGLSWKAWTNETPTGTQQSGSQPTCLNFGMPEERSASIDGRAVPLRAGERVGKFPDFRPIWCATSHYKRCQGQAFFGEIASTAKLPIRADFLQISLDGILSRTTGPSADGSKSGLESLRDLGDMNRDFEGPTEALTKWHCNEYGAVDGLWKVFAGMVGEPGGSPDPKAATVWKAMLQAAFHHATVDIYHVEAGPLEWIWGAWFQHAAHGSAGSGSPHRGMAPNTSHFNSDGVSIVRYLAADPVIADGIDRLQRRTLWKVENGPGMPGIPQYTGEERATANVLRILLEGRIDRPVDFARYTAAINLVIASVAARPYVSGVGTTKVKPWMVCLMAQQLEFAIAAGFPAASAPLATIRNHLATDWLRSDPTFPNLWYQRNPDVDAYTGFWNLLAADVLRTSHPSVAASLYSSGARAPWYQNNPLEWPRVISAVGCLNFGHQFDAQDHV